MQRKTLPPYPLEVSLVDRQCRGKINIRRRSYGYTQTERFHEHPLGEPPFIDVQTYYFCGSYHYDTHQLIGFISPTIEFLGEQGTHYLLDLLGELFTTEQAALLLRRSPRYLEKLRRHGEGPKFWRIADGTYPYEVFYELRDIENYAEAIKNRPERRGGSRKHKKQKE